MKQLKISILWVILGWIMDQFVLKTISAISFPNLKELYLSN